MEKSCRRGHVARSGKRRVALLMSLCLIGTMIPAMPGGAVEVQAATGAGTEPSVSAYATKTQLMDSTFKPDANGTSWERIPKYQEIIPSFLPQVR